MEQTIPLANVSMSIFTYRPDCPNPSLLLVFHGANRQPQLSRNSARSLADRLCMLVVAPLFDKERFPSWSYQRGGITRKDAVRDPHRWTGHIVHELVAWVRKQEQRDMDYSLIGHSAGGQFLSRVAAFVPTDAKRIVIANPSTHVIPNLNVEAPFGMGKVYSGSGAEAKLRRYLEQPVTIFLGTADLGDENRNDGPAARVQGITRYERGLNVYKAGQTLASSRGWKFNWRLVEVPGVGHSSNRMFSSKEAVEALAP
jgi:pimeloyl-ACP methyl ester carboxylesterase